MAKAATLRKGQFVTYRAGSLTVEAIVLRAHRDSSATVEARHFLKSNAERYAGYLGYRYRMPTSQLQIQATS